MEQVQALRRLYQEKALGVRDDSVAIERHFTAGELNVTS
jgi:hypothetical protein